MSVLFIIFMYIIYDDISSVSLAGNLILGVGVLIHVCLQGVFGPCFLLVPPRCLAGPIT